MEFEEPRAAACEVELLAHACTSDAQRAVQQVEIVDGVYRRRRTDAAPWGGSPRDAIDQPRW